MRVYLCFLERSQNPLSLPYCAFFLNLYQSQSAEFCEIVVAENRIGVNVLLSSWFNFGVLVCCLCSMDEILIRFSLVFDRWMITPTPPLEPMDGSVVMGCTAQVSHPASGRVALVRLHGASHVSWPPIPSVQARALQCPCGHYGSPHRPDHDGLVYHGSG